MYKIRLQIGEEKLGCSSKKSIKTQQRKEHSIYAHKENLRINMVIELQYHRAEY